MGKTTNIQAGLIESYCLGLLSPEESKELEQQASVNAEVKQLIDDFMLALEQCAMANAITPPAEIRSKAISLLQNLQLEEAGDLNQLPILNKYSDHSNWLQIVRSLLPQTEHTEIFAHELRNDDQVFQVLIWTAVDVPDEVHENEGT